MTNDKPSIRSISRQQTSTTEKAHLKKLKKSLENLKTPFLRWRQVNFLLMPLNLTTKHSCMMLHKYDVKSSKSPTTAISSTINVYSAANQKQMLNKPAPNGAWTIRKRKETSQAGIAAEGLSGHDMVTRRRCHVLAQGDICWCNTQNRVQGKAEHVGEGLQVG